MTYNLTKMQDELIRDERLMLKPYRDSVGKLTIGQLDVRPALPLHDSQYTCGCNPEPLGKRAAGNSSGSIQCANLQHLGLGELGDPSPILPSLDALKSNLIGMEHLSAHGAGLQVSEPIVGLDAIDVIDSKPLRHRSPERLEDDSMHQVLLRVPASTDGEGHTQMPGITEMLFQWAIRFTPEAAQPFDHSCIANSIRGLEPQHGTPLNG